MPELPEVEVVRRGLTPQIAGRKILQTTWSGKPLRLPVPLFACQQAIEGHKIREIDRRGKYLLIRMDNSAVLAIHLGMSGRLGLFPETAPVTRHDHLCWRLDNGMELRFNDSRRFGSVQVFETRTEEEAFFILLGPEPFEKSFCAAYLFQNAGNRRRPVKNFLMDGRVVAGIGNIYASEILYAAHVNPATAARNLSRGRWEKIVQAVRLILDRAIACGGTTVADFVDSSGNAGNFQIQLQVYGRAGEPCRRCGARIIKSLMAGRSTYYCPQCQQR